MARTRNRYRTLADKRNSGGSSTLAENVKTLTKSIGGLTKILEKDTDASKSGTSETKKLVGATKDAAKTTKEETKEEKKKSTRYDRPSYNRARATSWDRLKTGNLGSNPIATVANGLLEGIASLGGPLGKALFNALRSIGEFAIGKFTEYMVVGYENQLKALNAITAVNVNTMKSNLGSWSDSLSGVYEAQNLTMSSNLAMVETQNAIDLANKKLQYSWGKDVIFLSSYLNMKTKEMEFEQKIQETRLKNAMEYIQTAEGYAKKTDEYGKKQDEVIRNYTRSVGLSEEQTRVFEKRALAMNNSLAKINATMEDALKIQMGMQEQSGRLIGFSDEDYMKSTAVGQIMGAENVAKFEAEMVIFNKSVESSTSIMEDMYAYANKMGLSQKKLTQNVLNNIKLANKYQFKGGVKGFIEFAKWAENVRFNVAQLGNMIEKIQTGGLEGIIKQSAQLQVLGGGFASHADPFRMAFNAFNDPESLAKDFYDSLKGEGLFDTATGELTQGAASQMRLRAAAEAYGFSYEDARTMIRERTRKENAMSQLRGSNFSEEQKNAIANVAQRDEKGNWFVNTLQGRKGLNELKPSDVKNLLSNEPTKDLVKYAEETLPLTQVIASAAKKVDAILGGETFDNLVDTVEQTTHDTVDAFTKDSKSVSDAVKVVHEEGVKANAEQLKKLGQLGSNIRQAYETQAQTNAKVQDIYNLLEKKYGEVLAKEERKRVEKGENAVQHLTKEQIADVKETPKLTDKDKFNIIKSESNNALADDNNGWFEKLKSYASAQWGLFQMEHGKNTTNSKASSRYSRTTENDVTYQAIPDELREKKEGDKTEEVSTKDAIASAGGTPMAVAAKDVTSIHDGLALADRRDTALFAKTGGPFDKLFNGIFDRINAVYDAFGIDRGTRLGRMTPLPFNPIKEMPSEMGIEKLAPRGQGGNNNEAIRFEPLKIEMNGRLELSSGGKSVDIMSELQNNPLLVREIAKMLSDSLSSKFYGGKTRYNAGQNTYFR